MYLTNKYILYFNPTDLCKDTSDTESYSSDEDLAFVEYELASSSGSETDLDGFSGTSSGNEVSECHFYYYSLTKI